MPLRSPRWRLVCLALLASALTFSFVQTIDKPDAGDLDFGSYYRAAVAVAAGETPYHVDEHGPMGAYPYAPAYAYLVRPLACLDYLWAFRCWLLVNWLATVAAFWLTGKLVEPDQSDRRWAAFLLTALVCGPYLWANLRVGQAGMLVTVACLGWAFCQRSGRPFTGGLLLAAACAAKLAPFVLVPYLVLRRDWRGLIGTAAGLLVLFWLPALWVGWEGAVFRHVEWARQTAATQVPIQTYRPGNQSLLAQLARLPSVSNGHRCYSLDNLDSLCRCYPLLLVLAVAALYGALWRDQRRRPNVHLAVLLVFMTLAHPRAWRCNYVALLLPCYLLVTWVCQRRTGWQLGTVALGGMLLASACPTHGLDEVNWSLPAWVLLGKHFWAGAAVAAACWFSGAAAQQYCKRPVSV